MKNIIPLSSIDHIFTGTGSYPIEFVFAYDGIIDADKLEKSLGETMKHFPPASARLVRVSGEDYAFQPEEGCYVFEVVESNVSFSDTDMRGIFLNPVETCEHEILTKIRLTQTPKGSVLGVSMSHAVADGFSYFFFLANWARAFHGKSLIPASHDRSLLIREGHETVDAGKIYEKAGLFYGEKRKSLDRDAIRWETILYPREELRTLLEEAQKDCEARLSHNDIVVGLLWKRFISRWNTEQGEHQTYINCPVDYRRLMEGFPKTYFGNAVALATTPLSYEKLMNSGLADLALMVRRNIAGINERYIHDGLKILNALNRQEGVEANERIHVSHPGSGLLVTNLSRLPVNDIRFDAGPPLRYEILTPVPRGAVILPHKDGVMVRVSYPEAMS